MAKILSFGLWSRGIWGRGSGPPVVAKSLFLQNLQKPGRLVRTYYIALRKTAQRRGFRPQKFTRIALLKIVEVW